MVVLAAEQKVDQSDGNLCTGCANDDEDEREESEHPVVRTWSDSRDDCLTAGSSVVDTQLQQSMHMSERRSSWPHEGEQTVTETNQKHEYGPNHMLVRRK